MLEVEVSGIGYAMGWISVWDEVYGANNIDHRKLLTFANGKKYSKTIYFHSMECLQYWALLGEVYIWS